MIYSAPSPWSYPYNMLVCLLYSWFSKLFNNRIFHPSSTGSLTDQYISLASKHSSLLTQDPTFPICSFFHVKHSQMPPFFTGLADSNTLQQLGFAQGSCLILQTLALKVYFLTAINASACSIIRKQRARWGRAWKTFNHQCCPAVLTLNSERHHLPRNTCAMSKASSIFHWRTESSLMTNTPQKTCHWTTESDSQDKFDGFFFPGNTALTFSNACFIEGGYKEQQKQPLEASFRRWGEMERRCRVH